MDIVKNSQILASAIAIALGLSTSQQAFSANDIEIFSGTGLTNISTVQTGYNSTTDFTSNADAALLGIDNLTNAWDAQVYSNVVVSTTESGSSYQDGDINFNVSLNQPSDYNSYLVLNAHNDINLNGTLTGYAMFDGWDYYDLTFNPDSDGLNGGSVYLNGSLSGYSYTTINGDLIIGSTGSYTFNHFIQTLTADSITVVAGGSFNFGDGSTDANGGNLTLTNSGVTIGSGGLLGDAFTLGPYSNLTLSNNNVLTIDSAASFTLNGGGLEVGSIINNGDFTFTGGSLTLTNGGLTVGAGGNITSDITSAYRIELQNDNILTIDAGSSVSINSGGTLIAGSIVNNGSFSYTSGHFELTNSGLTIGTGGLLGDSIALSSTNTLTIAGDVGIDSGASLSVGGADSASNHFQSNLNNQGTVTIDASFTVDGTLNNDGVGSSTTINAGTLTAGGISNNNGGGFNLTSGVVELGAGVISNDGVGSNMAMDGGSLNAGSIVNTNDGTFTFTSGRIDLSNSGLTVGAGGLFGNIVALSDTRSLTLSGDVSVESGGTLSVDGWSTTRNHVKGNLNNQGTVSIATSNGSSSSLTVDGAITNDGVTASMALTTYDSSLTAGSISNINGASFNATLGDIDLGTGALSNDGTGSSSTLDLASWQTFTAGSISNTAGGSTSLIAGNINLATGVVSNDGVGSNTTLDGATLTAGSISNTAGGTFDFTTGRLNLTNSGLTVGTAGLLADDVTLSATRSLSISGDMIVDSAAALSVAGGTNSVAGLMTNSGTVTVGAGSLDIAGAIVNDGATASLTLNGGSLSADSISNANGGSFFFNAGDLALTNSGLTVGAGGLLGNTLVLDAGKSLSVSDTIIMDATGSIEINGGSFTFGIVDKNAGGSFLFNSGTLHLTNGLTIGSTGLLGSDVYLGGSRLLSTAVATDLTVESGASLEVGGWGYYVYQNVGGSLNNSGTIDMTYGNLISAAVINDGATASITLTGISDSTASYYQYSGQLRTGAITNTNGANITLDGGILNADSITNSNGGTFTFTRGDLSLDNATIGNGGLVNDLTLNWAKSLRVQDGLDTGVLTINSGSTLTMDGGVLYADSINNAGNLIFNSGHISIYDTAGVTIGNGGAFGNELSLGNDSSLSVRNGVFTVEAGASLALNGGSLYADAGISNNGNFSFTSGHLDTIGGLAVGDTGLLGNNVALSSNRTLDMSGSVNVETGATLSQSSGVSALDGDLTNNGYVSVTGGNLYTSGNIINDGVINIGSGAALGDASLINNQSTTSTATYMQNAGYTRVNGTLAAPTVIINNGSLYGSGTIDGDLMVAGGHIRPGNSPGTLEITGDFVLTSAGTLHMEVGSDGGTGYLWDQLIVGGAYDIQLDSMIQFSLLDGITISDFTTDFGMTDFFRTGTAGSDLPIDALTLAFFGNANIYTFDPLLSEWYSMTFDATGAFTEALAVSAVPVPAAVWLFGSGLLGLIGVARHRDKAA